MSANQKFPLLQKKVAATGKLRKYTRKMLMAMLKERGAYPTCYVSSRTDFLIVGEKPGIKLEKYEEKFLSDKPVNYMGKLDPYYSPIASIVLDAFFTDGEN